MTQISSLRGKSGTSVIATVLVVFDIGVWDPDSPRVQSWEERFVRLADGSWASDAFVAVQRGRAGSKVYAEALHLPGTMASAPKEVRIDARFLRPFRGLPAVIVGVTHPGRGFPVAITAEPSLCDRDWVSEHLAALRGHR